MAQTTEFDFLSTVSDWDRIKELEPVFDTLLGAPEVPNAVRKNAQLARLRAEHLRHLYSADTAAAAATLKRIEGLDDTYFFRPREIILGRELDKRNFRKKVLSMGILKETNEIEKDVAHRAARLFRFDERAYQKLTRQGFNFEI